MLNLLFLFLKVPKELKPVKLTYILLFITALLFGCNLTKNVPEGKYLVKKNKIEVEGGNVSKPALFEIVRQPENTRFLGLKFKLAMYNSVDSTKVANKRARLDVKLREKNAKKKAKEDRINNKRIEAARARGDSTYVRKSIPLKDTVEPKMFFREWAKYKVGEPPVILDTALYNRTIRQMDNYLRQKGYYYSETSGEINYKDNKKAIVTYKVLTGERYYIDSHVVICENSSVLHSFLKFEKEQGAGFLDGQPLDADYLNSIRTRAAKYLRDDSFYGFSPSSISFEADTNNTSDYRIFLKVKIADRLVRSEENRDSLISKPYRVHLIRDVYFHVSDTLLYKGNYKNVVVDSMELELSNGQFFQTLDTLFYAEITKKNDQGEEELARFRMAYFLYNGEMFVKPRLIEAQNYLEHTNVYKDYYLDRSYQRLMELGVFQVVKPVFEEVKGADSLDIHYYLVPVKKRSFGIEPRATNSNGFLGVSASINYVNKNLFHYATKLTLSLSGGFESQPPIFDETVSGEKIKTASRSFNTFEFGPSVKLEIPGIFPIPLKNVGKRSRPRTQISAAYNIQNRNDFDRNIFQTNYLWKFYVDKTQIFTIGLPTSSVIKFVRIKKSDAFAERLNDLNDLFLINAYSDQLIWQDIKLSFEYNDKNADSKVLNPFDKGNLYNLITFDPAGMFLSAFNRSLDTAENGQKTVFGVPYSQFLRVDNELIYSYPFKGKRSLHFHALAGFGIPYGNTTTSLPYDYAFFAGGANDNRGWKARSLGPGAYKYYLDQDRTATQIGDIRIGGSAEYRFSLGGPFRGAVFADAGNIWLFNEDENRPGGQISNNWHHELAIAVGAGIRYDFNYFVIRFDLGFPVRNPALPDGARWVYQSRQPYYDEGIDAFGAEYKDVLPKPFIPQLHFGINYPF